MKERIGYTEALELILVNVPGPTAEEGPLMDLAGRVLADDLKAVVDSPSVDASLKDGYAVRSREVAGASPEKPVRLRLTQFTAAGERPGVHLGPGEAVRVTTGAPAPQGADAILAGEFAFEENGWVVCQRDAGPGRNILGRGTDVRSGETLARAGERLGPALIGLLAAAGLSRARVAAWPRVAVIGTGDEVVAPGRDLTPGKLYASNMVETVSWLKAFGFPRVTSQVAPDQADRIRQTILDLEPQADAFITSGGAWGSERDLMPRLLGEMGWKGFFHRIRLGPGKAAGFGLLDGRPFFILPGGPPSHEAAFLLLALPGLLAMAGFRPPFFPETQARLVETVEGPADWTQVVHAVAVRTPDGMTARPVRSSSRLGSMARKNALFLIPEGVSGFDAGNRVPLMLLIPGLAGHEPLF